MTGRLIAGLAAAVVLVAAPTATGAAAATSAAAATGAAGTAGAAGATGAAVVTVAVGRPWMARRTAPQDTYRWPLAGAPRVGRPFDPPETTYGRGHRGVDLVATVASPVLAAGAGTVVFAAPLAGRGVVSVQHADGLRTTYEPVTAQVGAGDAVGQGQPLGVLEAGHAGCPAAACLHWGVRRGAEYLDPLRLLGRWEVRLLPWQD